MSHYHCTYCERQLIDPKRDKSGRTANLSLTKDHVTPKSQGGRKTVDCCRQCNILKGDLNQGRWRMFMAAHPVWWKKFHSPAQVKNVARDLKTARDRKNAAYIAHAIRMRLRSHPIQVARPPLCRGLAA